MPEYQQLPDAGMSVEAVNASTYTVNPVLRLSAKPCIAKRVLLYTCIHYISGCLFYPWGYIYLSARISAAAQHNFSELSYALALHEICEQSGGMTKTALPIRFKPAWADKFNSLVKDKTTYLGSTVFYCKCALNLSKDYTQHF